MFIFASLMFVASGVFTVINADIQNLEETGNRIKAEQESILTATRTAITGD